MNASPRGPMCFRCLIFSLSGPCELLFLLCFILILFKVQYPMYIEIRVQWISEAIILYCLLVMRSGECDVVSLYVLCFSVNGSVCFVCSVFDRVCELFGETICNMFWCVCYFVVECYGLWLEVLYWIDHAWCN